MTIPRKRFQTVGQNVQKLIKPMLSKRGFSVSTIITNWNQIVGDELASRTIPEKIVYSSGGISGGTFKIRINSSALALEIQHMEPQLREKINTYFGYNAISRIKIIQGPVRDGNKETNKKRRELSKLEQIDLTKRLKKVSDPVLRNSLSALGSSIRRDS